MTGNTFNVKIKKSVFAWLIESSGWTYKEIADKIGISERIVSDWKSEKEEVEIPINKVEIISNTIKRPLAAFFISSPPKEPELPKDFRKLPSNQVSSYSKETLLSIRKARRLQKIGNKLLKTLDRPASGDVNKYSLSDNPEQVAIFERGLSGISIKEQISWKDERVALSKWRNWAESKNILVFQMKMPMEDGRGFTLSDGLPYVIVLNHSDSIRGRLFSLFHEYAHILLKEPVICNFESNTSSNPSIRKIENWCDRFAGAFILPKAELANEIGVLEKIKSGGISEGAKEISRRYKISEQGALVRLRNLNYINTEQYGREYLRIVKEIEDYLKKKKEEESEKERGGGLPGDKRCYVEKGEKFVSLVLESSNKGIISEPDAMDYLDIKVKNFEKIKEA